MCLMCDKENLPVKNHFAHPFCDKCLKRFSESITVALIERDEEELSYDEIIGTLDSFEEELDREYGDALASAIILEIQKYIDLGFEPKSVDVHSFHKKELKLAKCFCIKTNSIKTIIGTFKIDFTDDIDGKMDGDFCISE